MSKQLKPTASTQEHLDIDDIVDDLVLLRTGWVALVMRTTAVNFDLLSESEQDATIYAYGAFLNSLSFPVQTLIRNKKADITSYFQTLEDAEAAQPNPDLKRQIQKYEDFLQSIVQQKTVLDKQFYLVVNYSPLESVFKSKKAGNRKTVLLESAKAALAPKRDHVIKQTGRLGLVTRQLITQELIELFYDIYNPAPTGTQRVLLDNASYTTPIVEPAIENPAPADMSKVVVEASNLGQQTANLAGATRNASNLRPVPQQPAVSPTAVPQPQQVSSQPMQTYQAPLQQQVPVQPPLTPPTVAPLSQGQAAALKGLQEAAAKAAAVVQAPGQAPQQQQPVSMGDQGDEGGRGGVSQ